MTTLGPVDRLILFGGGVVLERLAERAHRAGLPTTAVLSPRHASELADGEGVTIADRLRQIVPTHVVADIADLPFGDTSRALGVSLGAAWIFGPAFIEKNFSGRLLNSHGRRLPQDRGGGGYSWQILMGNRLGFCLAHLVDRGVDTGPIIALDEFLYPAGCRIPSDFERVSNERNESFLWALVESVRDRPREFATLPQPEHLSTYWPRLHADTHGWIDWQLPVDLLDRSICAFDDPYPGARTTWRGRPIRLKRSTVDRSDGDFHPFQSGLVYRTNGRWLCIAAKGATLIVESVLDDAGASILAEIGVGERLATPQARLEETTQRVFYSPLGPVFPNET